MISIPPFQEEAVQAAERKELATRILIANYPNPSLIGLSHVSIAADAVNMADALLAELAK